MSFRSIPENTQRALELLNAKYAQILKTKDFYLAGGTSLALQFDHRISYDLDFFSPTNFEPKELENIFVDEKLENIETAKGTLKFMLNNCAVSFFYYPYSLIKDFKYIDGIDIDLADMIDIGLMKITAIADRGFKKDFVDLYFILQKIGGINNLLENFKIKYPNANYYHYLVALTYFDDAEKSSNPQMIEPIDWNDVKIYFEKEVSLIQ